MLEEAGSREDDDEFLSDLDDLSVDDSENDNCDEGDDSKNDDSDERKKDSSSCVKEWSDRRHCFKLKKKNHKSVTESKEKIIENLPIVNLPEICHLAHSFCQLTSVDYLNTMWPSVSCFPILCNV